MHNPFEYGGVVGRKSFCNRKKELADIDRVLRNSEKLFIYAERRLGKTSLIKIALNKLQKDEFISVYVDLWPTNQEGDLALALAKAVAEASASTLERVQEFAKHFFSAFRPSAKFDEEGNPQIVFGVSPHALAQPSLDDVLNSLPIIAAKAKKRLVIVFDEFQQILEYGNDAVEKRMRSIIQHHGDIAYVFLGSRKHLIQKMFLDKQRPLFRSAAHYPLGMISEKDWLPFIQDKFEKSHRSIDDELIRQICKFAGGHPFYTQHLCHAIWELTELDGNARQPLLAKALDLLLDRESYAFSTLWDSLTQNQKIFLIGIAGSNRTSKPFAGNFVKQSGMGTASNVQRAAKALINKDILERDGIGSFIICDRFFSLWIQREIAPAHWDAQAFWDADDASKFWGTDDDQRFWK